MPPFPPISVLRKIKTLHLNIDLPADTEIDAATLVENFQEPLRSVTLKFVDAGVECDAQLVAKIMLIKTVTGPTGEAMAYAYVITLHALCVVGNIRTESVCVWQDTQLGSAQAANLVRCLYDAAHSAAEAFATRLTE